MLIFNLYFHFKEQWQIDGLSYIEHSNWKTLKKTLPQSWVVSLKNHCCLPYNLSLKSDLILTCVWKLADDTDPRVQIEIECWTIEHFCEKGKLVIAFCGWSSSNLVQELNSFSNVMTMHTNDLIYFIMVQHILSSELDRLNHWKPHLSSLSEQRST